MGEKGWHGSLGLFVIRDGSFIRRSRGGSCPDSTTLSEGSSVKSPLIGIDSQNQRIP